MKTKIELLKYWTEIAKDKLEGRRIEEVRYLNDEEMKMMNWSKRPIAIILDNGEFCVPSCDEEGNDGGVIFYGSNGVLPTLNR